MVNTISHKGAIMIRRCNQNVARAQSMWPTRSDFEVLTLLMASLPAAPSVGWRGVHSGT